MWTFLKGWRRDKCSIPKEIDMTKSNETENAGSRVVWQLTGDALKPTQTPYGFIARNPVQVSLRPGEKRQVKLQVQANLPMIVFAARGHADMVTVPDMIVYPGQDVVCIVENKSQHVALSIDDKEGLVVLYPMTFNGTAEVG